MRAQLAQQIKFGLWNIARRYPALEYPIRYAGRVSTRKFCQNHKKKMQKMVPSLLPANRYLRTQEVPTQCQVMLTQAELESPTGKGIALLLNHMRIPYHQIVPSDDLIFKKSTYDPALIISLAHHCGTIQRLFASTQENKTVQILFCASKGTSQNAEIHELAEDPAELLPYNKGLRSSLTAAFVKILLTIDIFPIITGFLTPQIGLRIDDVSGKKIETYLPPIRENGWIPNLGVFLDDFQRHGTNSAAELSRLAAQAQTELSPHAFSANRFLFFDYRNGCPLTQETFTRNWRCAQEAFASWGFPISPVLNPHFHVFSKSGLPLLRESGVRYIFSELGSDLMTLSPNALYLPSGDPLCTTGQTADDPMQIFSGDSAQDCNQPASHYDFLMHRDPSDPIETAAQKIVRRLERSIYSGFAAFVTTHEYLLNTVSPSQHTQLWNTVEYHLQQFSIPGVKTSLADIGHACFDHTHTIIHCISHQNGQWNIHLKGKASGRSHLTVFFKNQIKCEFDRI